MSLLMNLHKRVYTTVGIIHTAGSPCRCAEAIEGGLNALGHEVMVANSEEIIFQALELARSCDLIVDHSDTFLGRGYVRFVVRSILETRGARIVGSGSRACRLADNKIAAKTRLGKAGIPTPPGFAVTSDTWNVPPWLQPPFVIKAAFEHMSRGIRLAYTEEEARTRAANLIEQAQQPVMVESYITGRELAISVIEGPDGLIVLPPLEWYSTSEDVFLAEKLKLLEPSGKTRPAASRAELSPSLLHELEGYARLAFKTLGLRDYARFDIRLSPAGTFFFLETNVTPSLEPLEAFAISARWAGISYPELIEKMLSSAIRRYSKKLSAKEISIELPTGAIKLEVPDSVHPPFSSSIELAKLLDIQPGERVLDLGSGSGLLSIAAAKLGARNVVAVDIDPLSLETTTINAQKNGVGGLINVYAGSWYEALKEKPHAAEENNRFDVIIATPPQTPAPGPFGPRYGGSDGTLHLFKAIDGAGDFLEPESGRLWLLAISLANPSALLSRLKELFREVTIVHETERPFTAEEYNVMNGGLMEYFLKLRASGQSEFIEASNGRYVFRSLFIRAARPR
ncbi:MAG: 50S ribosomal protein L11 methyltransferase [Proteobacteria bacterium]|nr:50S ribosomal protein L11 methyltransferase [Pseudomonadota bacterium]